MLSEMKKTNVRTNRMGPKVNIIIDSGKIRSHTETDSYNWDRHRCRCKWIAMRLGEQRDNRLDNEVQDDAMVVKYESTGMTKSRRMFVKG